MIIAHRGYKKEHPENTIAAFDAAFMAGADAIETDVRIAEDGTFVVSHDPVKSSKALLSLDELFEYISQKDAPFFLELKSASAELLGKVIKKIDQLNAWERIHVMGFSENLKTAVRAQRYFPQLLVDQILRLPSWSHVLKPAKSNAVSIGWISDTPYSEPLFRWLISAERLVRLKEHFERNGFKVFGGVLNREHGIRYFRDAGISDIFTDEVEKAVLCHKQPQQL